jgi:hypothetical protein
MSVVFNLDTPRGQAPANPAKTITGEYLAKATRTYPAECRAEDAARWQRGELQIKPTAKLACEVFRVSYPRLKQAQARLEPNKHSRHHGNGMTPLSDQALERIVAETGVDRIWRVIDRLTAPELPLAAAE